MKILLDPNAGGGGAPAAPAAAQAPVASLAADSGARSTPNLNNAFDQLDSLLADPAPSGDGKAGDAGSDDKGASGKQPDDKSLEGKDSGAKDGDQNPPAPVDKSQKKPEKAATLRENYERLKSDLADRESRLAKYQEMEKTGKLSDPEKKSFEEKLTAAEKRRAELEDKIKFVDYKESTEYKDKYEKPFIDAYADGRASAAQYKINDPLTGEARQAKPEDFDAIMQISDPDAAAAKIEELFGTGVKATTVAAARQKVLDAHRAKSTALDEFSKKGSEMAKVRSEQNQKLQAELASAWKAERDAGIERLPELFKPADGDDKGNAALDMGYKLADLAFGAIDADGVESLPQWVQDRMVNGKLPPQEMAKLHAAIRNKAGAFDRAALQLKTQKAKIADLEKQLEGFKSSSPKTGEQGRTPSSSGNLMDSVDAAIERFASR